MSSLQGALLQLVTAPDNIKPAPIITLNNGYTDCKTNKNIEIMRETDCIWFDTIVFDKKYNIDDIISIGIIVGGIEYFFPMKLIKHLCQIINTSDHINIKFPISLFTKDLINIPLISLMYHAVSFRINSKIEMYYDIITINYYYDTKERREIASKNKEFYINHFITKHIDYEKTKIELPNMYAMSGMFLQTKKIPTKLSLTINNNIFFDYDQDIVELHMMQNDDQKDMMTQEKWSVIEECFSKYNFSNQYLIEYIMSFVPDEYLFWIPIMPHKNWKKSKNLICYQKIFSSELCIEGCTGSIYFLHRNIGIITDGMMTEKYSM